MDNLVPIETLQRLLVYNFENGHLFWFRRDRAFFKSDDSWRAWNAKLSGKLAFTTLSDHGYLQGSILNRTYKAHRVCWALYHGEWPKNHIDHINGNKIDNRIANLRDIPKLQNHHNMRLNSSNTSGTMGVYWSAKYQKWMVSIKVNNKPRFLGSFDDKDRAVAARKAGEIKYGFHPNHGRAA